jgi:protein TonB
VLKNQPLTWSRTALRSGEQGAVIVRVTVNADGGVDDVEVLRADHTGYGIPEAAAEAASGCRFKPGMKDGVPVTTYAFITWRYDFSER